MSAKPDANCFEDEIAIDFPSVGHLVARVREAFLAAAEDAAGDPADTVRAEVCLSTEEAHRGAVLPIEVLLRAMCAECGGRGETWAEPCRACGGSGETLVPRRLKVTVPPRVADGSCFHFRIRAPHEALVHVELRIAITET